MVDLRGRITQGNTIDMAIYLHVYNTHLCLFCSYKGFCIDGTSWELVQYEADANQLNCGPLLVLDLAAGIFFLTKKGSLDCGRLT